MTGRLIDADKLNIRDVSTDYWSTVMGVEDKDIDDAETVEAIPIEWIKNFIDRANDTDAYAVARMLDEWEEEDDKTD